MDKTTDFSNLRKKINSIIEIPVSELEYLFTKILIKEVPKGQHIIQKGKISNFICYVNKGVLRTYLTKGGNDINTEFFFEDSMASAFTSFLSQQPTSLTIEALEDSALFYITKDLLEELYKRNPLWFAVGKYIFEKEFIKKCKRESSFLQHDAKERYLALQQQYPLIETRVSLFHIASYLGIQPETLSRIRSEKFSKN